MYHTLKIFRQPTFYQEIATGLTALAMTEVVVTQLRRFEQSDKLKFELLTKSAGMGYNTIYIGENGQSACVSTLAVFTYDSGGSCYVSKLQG